MSRDTTDVANQLLAENAALKAQIAALTAENLDLKHPGTYLPSKRETPATDAAANALRAEGIHFAANRMLAVWDSGFIDDTPAQAYDISGAVLSAVEFLPNASPEEFKRDFADGIRREIKSSTADAAKDGE
ncbi:ead/Ea22-like family protein [Mixta calida]|uniref:ead/Ea22-like family protein n=1 Tax=Mixta calida TaxID=665913 RepID=UPI0034D3EB3F